MTPDDLPGAVDEIVSGHPAVRSVTFTGSRERGDANPWSDWDFFVETRDFPALAAALPSMIEPLRPLVAQWDRPSDQQCYAFILHGPRKVDLIFDVAHRHEPPHEVSAGTLSEIDAHFWDWVLWLTSKVAAGKEDVVRSELAKMTGHLLGPLGVPAPPSTLSETVDAYLSARTRAEGEFGTEVSRELGDEVMRVIHDQRVAMRSGSVHRRT